MEGPSRKRKISHDNEENQYDQKEDDEEKMEKFFALIKRIRETRETLIKCSGEFTDKKENNKIKKQRIVEKDRKQIEVWNPSFRHEDFMENDGTHVTLVGTSQVIEEEGAAKEDVKEGLDLNLSL